MATGANYVVSNKLSFEYDGKTYILSDVDVDGIKYNCKDISGNIYSKVLSPQEIHYFYKSSINGIFYTTDDDSHVYKKTVNMQELHDSVNNNSPLIIKDDFAF